MCRRINNIFFVIEVLILNWVMLTSTEITSKVMLLLRLMSNH